MSEEETKFIELRRTAHRQSWRNLHARLELDPFLTIEELALGSFVEGIEPQVCSATRELNRKGYCTWSSGFACAGADLQETDGPFILSANDKAVVASVGGQVRQFKFHRKRWTSIYFTPAEPNLDAIRKKWDLIVSVISDKGFPAVFSESWGAWDVRRRYGPEWQIIEIFRLRRLLDANRAPGWNQRWRAELRRLKKGWGRAAQEYEEFCDCNF